VVFAVTGFGRITISIACRYRISMDQNKGSEQHAANVLARSHHISLIVIKLAARQVVMHHQRRCG